MKCAKCNHDAIEVMSAEPEVGIVLDLWGCENHGEFFVENGIYTYVEVDILSSKNFEQLKLLGLNQTLQENYAQRVDAATRDVTQDE